MKSVIRTIPTPTCPTGSDAFAVEEVVNFEYHVIFSTSYDVPVLYFKAVRQG